MGLSYSNTVERWHNLCKIPNLHTQDDGIKKPVIRKCTYVVKKLLLKTFQVPTCIKKKLIPT